MNARPMKERIIPALATAGLDEKNVAAKPVMIPARAKANVTYHVFHKQMKEMIIEIVPKTTDAIDINDLRKDKIDYKNIIYKQKRKVNRTNKKRQRTTVKV